MIFDQVEAKKWFKRSDKPARCKGNDGEIKTCATLKEALDFFDRMDAVNEFLLTNDEDDE